MCCAWTLPTGTLTTSWSVSSLSLIHILMVKCGLTPSKGEARRLIQQGGVELNGEKVTDTAATVPAAALEGEGATIKKGKKVFHRAVLV